MVNVIAEIGINHKGSFKNAKRLIKIAKNANCWGVKFQYRNINTFYKKIHEIGDEILIDEMKRTELSVKELQALIDYAKSNSIKIGISLFRISDIKKLLKIIKKFDFYKVPSAEAINLDLIDELLKYKKPVMVSTGGHKYEDLKYAFSKYKNKNLILFHCVANYPVKLGDQNLNFIKSLKKIGFANIGYSSHDTDYEVCLLAISLGIKWIERHLTLNKDGDGLDDSSSSEGSDFLRLNQFIKFYKDIFGKEKRIPNQGEKLNMQNLGTGLYLKKNIKKNNIITKSDFEIKAPRLGISVGSFICKFSKKKIVENLHKGEAIKAQNFEDKKKINTKIIYEFAISNSIGIPVRLHDFNILSKLIPIKNYEFHLSYKEVFSKNLSQILDSINKDDNFSIHMPDYLFGNRIIDPISENKNTRNDSRKMIDRVVAFANKIENKIQKKVPIISSFSQDNDRNKFDLLDDLFEYLKSKKLSKYEILPQWLPVYGWYFGGSVKINLFNSFHDIQYLKKNNFKICLDICHLVLSANYFEEKWEKWLNHLYPLASHFHLADADGIDSEGLQIGSGCIKDFSSIIEKKGMKIIEVWQAHHNQGYGFNKALNILHKQNYKNK
jgi:sialic acid synthase SpsE/sugar phosphate isomerase/epimerase